MKQKFYKLLHIIALCLTISQVIHPRLTTLKHFDPAPNYSANDNMMPPNSQFLNLKKARIKGEEPNKQRYVGFTVSGYCQKAVRARGYNGNTEYGTVQGEAANAFELGDFRGTMNIMGLFLGANPSTQKYIHTENMLPTNISCYVTPCSIQDFYGEGKYECLQNVALGLIGATTTEAGCTYPTECSDYTNTDPLTFMNCSVNNGTYYCSLPVSIFDPNALKQDTTYFGAFCGLFDKLRASACLAWLLPLDLACQSCC